MTPEERIEKARLDINAIDAELICLLNKRMDSVLLIGEAKRELGQEVYVPAREQAVKDRLKKDERYEGLVDAIWPEIMAFARSLQK
ncbi:MAG: chorismate mutase [Clostridia bacterium]|nr:chorismate mutase [Clostridia bacterium]